jgi:chromosome segregation ATPase
MQKQLEERLKVLKDEFEAGQQKLAELEAEANNFRQTMLRISGAIQVLEEELAIANETREPVSQPSDSSNEKPGTPLRSVNS